MNVVLQARFVANVEDSTVAALTLTGGALPLLILASRPARDPWSALPFDVRLAILYGGVISLAIASVFWYRGVGILGATRTGIDLDLEPAFAQIAAWIWMHEHPTPMQGVGAVISRWRNPHAHMMDSKNLKLVLFDIDGTILWSDGA